MEMTEVETVETNMEGDEDDTEHKARIIAATDEDSMNAGHHEQDSNEESNDDTLNDHTPQIIPIVTQTAGGLTYQTAGNQQYSVSVPAQNVTNVKIVKVVPLPHARSEVWSYFGFIADDDGEIQDKKKAICKICASTLAYSGNTTNLFTHLKAMHPEANPQKLAPTNRTPRTGKKLGKRKFLDLGSGVVETGGVGGKTVNLGSAVNQAGTQQYIIRAITYSGNADSTASTSLFDGETATLTTPTSNGGIKSPNVKTVSAVNSGTPSSSSSDNLPIVSCDDITNSIVNMLVKDCRPICITQSRGFEEMLKLLAPGYRIPEEEKLKILVKKRYEEVRRNLILRAMEDE